MYEFCGRLFLQSNGGPIGLRCTASLASLIMKMWDRKWVELLEREKIEVLLYFSYVDDSRNFVRPLNLEWRWNGENFVYSTEAEAEDIARGDTDQKRTTDELVKAMDSLVSYLKFEGEESGMFPSKRLPTLDTELWYDCEKNEILYSFYEKPMCSENSVSPEADQLRALSS